MSVDAFASRLPGLPPYRRGAAPFQGIVTRLVKIKGGDFVPRLCFYLGNASSS
jgi:hypothetical protein